MARQNITLGVNPNDGTGESLRSAMAKVNDNFIELFGEGNENNNVGFGPNTVRATDINGDLNLETSGSGTVNVVQGLVVNSGGELIDSNFLDSAGDIVLHVDVQNGRVGVKTDAPTTNFTVAGTANITGNVTLSANTTLGVSGTNQLVLNSRVYSAILPGATGLYNLGSPTFEWDNIFANELFIDTVTASTITVANLTVTVGGTLRGDLITAGPIDITSSGFATELYTQTLTANRVINLPDVSGTVLVLANLAPVTSIGAVGDREGFVAADASFFYYCTADYDGSTAVWKRATLGSW